MMSKSLLNMGKVNKKCNVLSCLLSLSCSFLYVQQSVAQHICIVNRDVKNKQKAIIFFSVQQHIYVRTCLGTEQ